MNECKKYAPAVLRLVLGVTFILAGVSKLGNPAGFVQVIKSMAPYLPELLGTAYGYALPYLEVVLGALLLLGLWTRVAAWVGAALVASFILGVALATPDVPFLFDPAARAIPNKDFGFLAIAISLGLTGAGALSLDARGKKCCK